MVTSIAPNLGHGRFLQPRTFYTQGEVQVGNAYAIYPVGGTYTFTGTAATLGVGIIPSGGIYTFTGTAATLGIGVNLTGGTYSYTGIAPILGVGVNIASGAYTFTGTPVTFNSRRSISITPSSYVFTGSPVNLIGPPHPISLPKSPSVLSQTYIVRDRWGQGWTASRYLSGYSNG